MFVFHELPERVRRIFEPAQAQLGQSQPQQEHLFLLRRCTEDSFRHGRETLPCFMRCQRKFPRFVAVGRGVLVAGARKCARSEVVRYLTTDAELLHFCFVADLRQRLLEGFDLRFKLAFIGAEEVPQRIGVLEVELFAGGKWEA